MRVCLFKLNSRKCASITLLYASASSHTRCAASVYKRPERSTLAESALVLASSFAWRSIAALACDSAANCESLCPCRNRVMPPSTLWRASSSASKAGIFASTTKGCRRIAFVELAGARPALCNAAVDDSLQQRVQNPFHHVLLLILVHAARSCRPVGSGYSARVARAAVHAVGAHDAEA